MRLNHFDLTCGAAHHWGMGYFFPVCLKKHNFTFFFHLPCAGLTTGEDAFEEDRHQLLGGRRSSQPHWLGAKRMGKLSWWARCVLDIVFERTKRFCLGSNSHCGKHVIFSSPVYCSYREIEALILVLFFILPILLLLLPFHLLLFLLSPFSSCFIIFLFLLSFLIVFFLFSSSCASPVLRSPPFFHLLSPFSSSSLCTKYKKNDNRRTLTQEAKYKPWSY